MDDQEFQDLKDVLQWLKMTYNTLDNAYREETGRGFKMSGPRKEPSFSTVCKVLKVTL